VTFDSFKDAPNTFDVAIAAVTLEIKNGCGTERAAAIARNVAAIIAAGLAPPPDVVA
jgi:hypothetical protein